MSKTKPLYRLGRAAFKLTHADAEFEPVVSRLLQHCENEQITKEQICDVQMGLSLNIGECINQMVAQHVNCLTIEAACLVSPAGQKVLISGVSNSGKTTTALALAFAHGWKVASENTTIIDPEKDQIISFAAPFNLKPGTRDLLGAAKIILPGFILREWYPMPTEMLANDCQAKLSLAVHFDGEVQNDTLLCQKNSVAEYTRKIFPISNLLSTRSSGKFMEYLPENSCYQIKNGSLAQRVQKILELCANTC